VAMPGPELPDVLMTLLAQESHCSFSLSAGQITSAKPGPELSLVFI